jgi:hypothetical protein
MCKLWTCGRMIEEGGIGLHCDVKACSGCPVLTNLSCLAALYCFPYLGLSGPSWLFCVLNILSRQYCLGNFVLAILSCQSCSGSPVFAVLSWLSFTPYGLFCYRYHVMSVCSVKGSGCPALTVLLQLSWLLYGSVDVVNRISAKIWSGIEHNGGLRLYSPISDVPILDSV